MRALVVTTINSPNKALHALADGARSHGLPFIVVGDTKTPSGWNLENAEYLPIEKQKQQFPAFCRLVPTEHYARKNIGYLVAMQSTADEIQETDDDTIPYEGFWRESSETLDVDAVEADSSCPWFNAYASFTSEEIWPRGFPLQFLREASARKRPLRASVTRALISQALINENPDVDAVYRLTRKLPVSFEPRKSVLLAPGAWCPFNSQNTTFRSEAFPLLYLPSRCSFRMTDIWRSFVAQRCLWEKGKGIVFQEATSYQERNPHDLLRDFSDEVPGYLLNDRIRHMLEECKLDKEDMLRNLVLCYQALVKHAVLPPDELPIVRAWCTEVERCRG